MPNRKWDVEKLTARASSPDAIKGLINTLIQFSECNLTEENCASFEVANRRIRNTATMALNQLEDDVSQQTIKKSHKKL